MIFLSKDGNSIIIEYSMLVEFDNTPPMFFVAQKEIIDIEFDNTPPKFIMVEREVIDVD